MMTQLNPPIPLKTPKGDAWAVALMDYGPQWDLLWVTFIEKTGECWTFRNPEIRQGANYTFSHPQPTAIMRPVPQTAAPASTPEPAPAPVMNGHNGHALTNGHDKPANGYAKPL